MADSTTPTNEVHPLSDLYPKAGGINFRYLELNGQKVKWQVIPIQINQGGARFDFKEQSHQTNDRIIGVVITTDDILDADGNIKTDAQKCINDSSIQLSIDNEELFPNDFACELISQKQGKTLYQCLYPCNERAFGSIIEGCIKSSSTLYTGQFTAKLHLCCIANKKN